jgi:hypothetical protein
MPARSNEFLFHEIQTLAYFVNRSDPTLFIISAIVSNLIDLINPPLPLPLPPRTTKTYPRTSVHTTNFGHPTATTPNTKRNNEAAQGLGERSRGTTRWNTDNVCMLGRTIYFPQHTHQKSEITCSINPAVRHSCSPFSVPVWVRRSHQAAARLLAVSCPDCNI